MSIGEFGGAFAEAFFASRAQKEKREQFEKLAKLEGQRLEQEIRVKQAQIDAQQGIGDFLGGVERSPGGRPMQQFDTGAPGELTEIQPKRRSLVESLAEGDPEIQALLLKAGADPLKIAQEHRLGQAQKSQDALFESIMGQGGGLTPEGAVVTGGSVKTPFGGVDFAIPGAAETLSPQQRIQFTNNLSSDFEASKRLLELNNILRGTPLEFGRKSFLDFVGMDARDRQARVDDALRKAGVGEGRRTQLLAAFDEAVKAMSQIQSRRLANLENPTDAARQAELAGLPTADKVPGAIEQVIGQFLQDELRRADSLGIPILNRAEIEREIKDIKSRRVTEESLMPTEAQQIMNQIERLRREIEELEGDAG